MKSLVPNYEHCQSLTNDSNIDDHNIKMIDWLTYPISLMMLQWTAMDWHPGICSDNTEQAMTTAVLCVQERVKTVDSYVLSI